MHVGVWTHRGTPVCCAVVARAPDPLGGEHVAVRLQHARRQLPGSSIPQTTTYVNVASKPGSGQVLC